MPKNRFSSYIVGGVILFFLIVYIIVTYNSLVKKEEVVKQKWSEVQNTYQRRLDLIPNLVNVVKGVSEFEQTTLEKIAETRSKAISGMSNDDLSAANYQHQGVLQDSLAAATNRIILLVEKYPVLKGTEAYAGLQAQLEGTERRIKVARDDFNESVANYNKAVRNFPSNIVSWIFGFKVEEGFEAVAGSEKTVEIKF
jgi:LemA protein